MLHLSMSNPPEAPTCTLLPLNSAYTLPTLPLQTAWALMEVAVQPCRAQEVTLTRKGQIAKQRIATLTMQPH